MFPVLLKMADAFVFCQNVDILKDPETVRQLGSILKTNVRACKAVGHPFVVQLGRIYLDMLNVYKCLSENISSAIQTNGEQQSLKIWFSFIHLPDLKVIFSTFSLA